MEQESFHGRLERLLKQNNLQQKDLAKMCGMSNNGISTWKATGSFPRADVAVKIADILNVSTDYLITGKLKEIDFDDELAYAISQLSVEKRHVVQAVVDSLSVF